MRERIGGQELKYRREEEPACPVMAPVADALEGWLMPYSPLSFGSRVIVKSGI